MTTLHRLLAALGALALLMLNPATAQAATIVGIEHDAAGTSHIGRPNADVRLGPTTLHTDLDIETGDFTATLPLPGTDTRFALAGFVPVTARVDFLPVGRISGRLDVDASSNLVVSGTARYYVRLSNIRIAGFPTFTGANCRTVSPVTIPVGTPAGESFDLLAGGRLTGSYSIGQFQNCGLNTWLINSVVPGSNNTIDLRVTNGRYV
ncbi:hypothetical protein [Nocardioides nitrophenolicus]|uniref:hypothetical protein n=1 Tax=Nocardioides nitrophenolicus TaxID=60489 RepID=UPI00195B5F97|nr:hypothetical protein [Nocardioides nitrophenolicus]MBM7516291.1 hypothetical protein [Nocardioides nitrophenolicus]